MDLLFSGSLGCRWTPPPQGSYRSLFMGVVSAAYPRDWYTLHGLHPSPVQKTKYFFNFYRTAKKRKIRQKISKTLIACFDSQSVKPL